MSWTPPTVTAQVAPGFHPRSMPSGGDWVDLPPVISFKRSLGKQDTLGNFTNGTATLVLDNGDFDLDQLVPGSLIYDTDGLPSTPVRIKFEMGAITTYRAGYHTLDGWNPTGSMSAQRVTVPLIDWLGWGSDQPMPQSRWESWVTREQPLLFLRGDMSVDDATTSDHHLYNMGQDWTGTYGDLLYNDTDYPDGHIFRDTGIVTGGDGPSMRFVSTPFGTWAGMRADPPELIAESDTWFVCFWMKAEAAAYGKQYIGIVGGSNEWFIGTDGAGQVVATVTVNSTPYSGTITVDHCDGQPHLIALRVVTVGGLRVMNIASDLGAASTSTMATASHTSGGGILEVNADEDTTISDVCYWDSWPTCQDGTTSMDLETFCREWVEGTDLFGHQDLENTTDRVAALGRYALVDDMPTLDLTMATPGAYYNTFVPSSTLEAAIRSLADANMGAAYMLSDGTLRIRDGSYTSSDADDYDTVHAQITDDDSATGPPVVIYTSTRERTGTRVDHLINDVRVEGVCYFFDVDSRRRYGVKSKTWGAGESLIFTDDLVDLAQAYMFAHKDPPIEFGGVTINVWGNEDYAEFVLDVLELEKRVGVRAATPDDGVELIDADHRIIHIEESFTSGTSWIVTLALEPAA